MPNRIVREGILSSEHVAKLEWAEEVFYRRLMSIVDDYGRCEANYELLRAYCYPLQTNKVSPDDIEQWLSACTKAQLLSVYSVAGKRYLEVHNFGQPQRALKSKCPSPDTAPDDSSNHLHASESTCMQTHEDASYMRMRSRMRMRSAKCEKPISPIDGGGSATRVRARESPPAADGAMSSVQIATALIGWERERHKAPRCSSGNVQIVAIAELGVTQAELRKAYEAAVADRDATDDPGPINAGFLHTFVVKGRAKPRSKGTDADWSRTDDGIKRKARELGLTARGGETYPSLKARCFDELHRRSNGAAQGAAR